MALGFVIYIIHDMHAFKSVLCTFNFTVWTLVHVARFSHFSVYHQCNKPDSSQKRHGEALNFLLEGFCDHICYTTVYFSSEDTPESILMFFQVLTEPLWGIYRIHYKPMLKYSYTDIITWYIHEPVLYSIFFSDLANQKQFTWSSMPWWAMFLLTNIILIIY